MNVPSVTDAKGDEVANVANGGLDSFTIVEVAAPGEQGVFIEGVQKGTASSIKEVGIGR